MATIDLNAATEEVTGEIASVDTSAPSQLALTGSALVPGVTGAGSEDIRVPRINVVQKMSDQFIETGFRPGDVVYAKEVPFGGEGRPGYLSILHVQVQWQQVLPYGSDTMPKVVNTPDEVAAAGGSTTIGAANEYSKIATFTCLVEAPEKLDEAHEMFFPLEFDGKLYSMAKWTVAKTAYRGVAVPVISTAAMFARNGGIHSVRYALSTKKETKGVNTWYAPVIKQVGRNTPEFCEFAGQFLQQ